MALLRILLAGLLTLVGAGAWAQGLESALRPGEVIRGHAKWEDDCAACHVRFDRSAQNERCMACHKDIGADVRQRSGFHGRLKPQACRSCHTDHKGRDARIVELDTRRFDHAQTDYTLKGRHTRVECGACHVAGRKYSQAPQDCIGCHRKDDAHKGSLGTACADCHREDDWKRTSFDHDKTRFALTGRHGEARCTDCHKGAQPYKDTPRACASCHRKDDDGPKGHKGRFGDRCESCHGTKAWKPPTFNHDTDTRWALRGKHRPVTCSSCHTGHLFRDKVGTECIACHRKDDRHEGSLGRECQTCHVEQGWKETPRFDHDRTRYPLLGKHRDARCESCHVAGQYKVSDTRCSSCHAKDDPHKPSLGAACEGCHSERGWKEVSRFDHGKTRFVLRERHAEVRCQACHRDTRYRETPRDCIGCHRKDDRHEGNLGTACGDCHGERRWTPASAFDHQRTGFPLRHAHAARTLACRACHADLRSYRPTPTECFACHRKDDRHEGQLGTRCDSCHDEVRWTRVRFDHSRARFPLLGRHLPLRCDACHTTARYRDAARECDACHGKDDVHRRAYGTACDSCHNARGWPLWTFDHQRRTRFPLDGAHQRTACARCHSQPAPAGKPIAAVGTPCSACHEKDDRHDGAFGAQCERCHVTSDWKQISRQRARWDGEGAQARTNSLGESSWFVRSQVASFKERAP